MASEGVVSFVEDVIKQHGPRLSDIDLASRRAEEKATRRSDAAGWLRRTVGVVIGKDLPEEPSEEEFRGSLRNGIILCNAFNKVYPGTIPKVIEPPPDSAGGTEGGPLSAFQYFENLRNFLVGLEDKGLPTFEVSDLEKGGKGSRVVDCVLALKLCSESGKNGLNKYGGIMKPNSGKSFFKRNTEAFMTSTLSATATSLTRSQSLNDKLNDDIYEDYSVEHTEMNSSSSLQVLVRSVLSDKKPEEVPLLVEALLGKVMQEFERRIANQNDMVKITQDDISVGKKTVFETDTTILQAGTKATSTEPKVEMEDDNPNNRTISKEEDHPIDEDASVHEEKQNQAKPTETALKPKEKDCQVKSVDEKASMSKGKKQVKSIDENSKEKDRKVKSIDENASIPKDDAAAPKKTISDDEEEASQNMLMKEHLHFQQQQREIQEASKKRLLKQCVIFDRQQKEIEELKQTLHTTKAGVEFMKSQYSEEFNKLNKHFMVLSSAACGYKKVLDENRKLYNQIQDLKGNIRVYCRVRPFLPGQKSGSTTIGRIDDGSISIITPPKYCKEGIKSFSFNKCFGSNASQADVFADTQPLIRSVLDGYNVCIFAYGQTGAGKTYTMSGPNNLTEKSMGVNYRALNDLFHISEERKNTVHYEISVQMIEIYNETVRDLLASDCGTKRLEIRNSSQTGLNVPDANLVPVASTSDVIDLMNLGQKNRMVTATAMNDRSSRSHSCLTIHVHGKDITSGTTVRGSLHLVDLAGSERVDKSEVKGAALKEAQHINKSLSALGDVISSLAQKSAHVPYRNSKLTQLLQDSLGGQAKTLMFVHISPEVDAVGETLSTLKFAERVASVELGAAKSNKDTGEVKELRDQIANLKAALARKEGEWESNGEEMEEADETMTGSDWVNKVMVNKLESGSRDDDSVKDWEGEESTEDSHRRFDSDSEDLENATTTSDSSEIDTSYQNLQKTSPTGSSAKANKIMKPKSRTIKTPETRTTSYAHVPAPARKAPNGPAPPNRAAKTGGVDLKRAAGKMGSGK